MADPKVILFDLPSRGRCGCWSLNPWKPRLVMNYKGVPYQTEWIEYPDVAPTLKEAGVPPNKEGMAYTIPTVRFPDTDTYVMDSKAIAHALEARFPSPPLHLDHPVLAELEGILPKTRPFIQPLVVPKIPRNVLNPRSVEYFDRTRKEWFGMPLEQYEKEKGGEPAWAGMEPVLKEIAGVLRRGEGGPFALGKEVSYADFYVVSLLEFMRRAEEGLFQRAVGVDPALKEVYEACRQWLQRDD